MTFQALHNRLDQPFDQTTGLRLVGADWCADLGYGKPEAPKFASDLMDFDLRPIAASEGTNKDNGRGVAT